MSTTTFNQWAFTNNITGRERVIARNAWFSAVESTAHRCKIIAQQRYLAENAAMLIDDKISQEFNV